MWWNTLLLALRSIRRNLMRSFLTVLGIVIGVSAVVTMVTVGWFLGCWNRQDVTNLACAGIIVGVGTPGFVLLDGLRCLSRGKACRECNR